MRVPVVTRTITSTTATVMVINPETRNVEDRDITIPRTYADNEAILKYIEKHSLITDVKVVSVVSTKVNTEVRRMFESDFIAHSEVVENGDDSDEADIPDEKPAKKQKNK